LAQTLFLSEKATQAKEMMAGLQGIIRSRQELFVRAGERRIPKKTMDSRQVVPYHSES
jgi:hypothetical protein